MYHQIQGQEVIKAPGTTSSTTQLGAVETPSVPSLKQTFSSWWGRRGLPVAPNFYLLQLLHWRDYADASLVRSSKVPGHLTPVRLAPTCQKKPEIIKVGEDVEKLECLCTVGSNVKWYSHYGKQYEGSSKN